MPTLDWIGKIAVQYQHNSAPFHLLKADPKLSVGDSGSGNLLFQGDDLIALKAILAYYAGQVILNYSLRQAVAAAACPPAKPVEFKSRPDAFWQSEQGKRLYTAGLSLRYKEPGAPYSETERTTPEWVLRLTDYKKELADWRPSDEKDEAAYYHQKAIIYEMLIELIPRGEARDKAIQAYVDFVANSSLQREKPLEWFFHAQSLLNRTRNSRLGEPAKVLAAFENSGNPVLILYTLLDKLGRGPRT